MARPRALAIPGAAFSLLEVGGLLTLPLFALPANLAGVPISRGLVHTALLGIAAFVLYAIFGVIVLRTDWPLATLGRAAHGAWNLITHWHRQPVTGLDQRLLAERDTIRAVLGKNWRQAAVLTAGRSGFDYSCLLAALRATGASPLALGNPAGLRRLQARAYLDLLLGKDWRVDQLPDATFRWTTPEGLY